MQKNSKIGTALITGAAKRLGREIAFNLASRGFDIVVNYNKSEKEAKSLVAEIKKKYDVNCEVIAANLFEKEGAKKLADFMVKNYSNWNLLINSASVFNRSKFIADYDSELFNNLNVHVLSPMLLSHEFAKNIQSKKIKNSQIINIVDKNIARFDTVYFYYLLTKKFLAEFTKMSALQLAPNTRVNAIAPGLVMPEENYENLEKIVKKIPLQRLGDAKNIVQTINFLLDNDFINGEIIYVDGGASLNHAG